MIVSEAEIISFTRELVPRYDYTNPNPLSAVRDGVGNCATRAYIIASTLKHIGEQPSFFISAVHGKKDDLNYRERAGHKRLDEYGILEGMAMGHTVVLAEERGLYFEFGIDAETITPVRFRDSQRTYKNGVHIPDPDSAISTYCDGHDFSFTSPEDIVLARRLLNSHLESAF